MPRDDLGQVRRDSPANWNSENPVLANGEPGAGIAVGDEPIVKIGDGVSDWSELKEIGYGKEDAGTAAALIADLPDLTVPAEGGLWIDTTDPDAPLLMVRSQNHEGVEVVNTTTETTSASFDITDFQPNDSISVVIFGGMTNNTGSNQNMTVRVKMTGITLAYDFTAIPTSASARSLAGSVEIIGTEFIGLLRGGAAGRLGLSGAGSAGADFDTLSRAVLIGGSTLTAGNTYNVTVTVQFAAASTNLKGQFTCVVRRGRNQP